MESAAEHEQPLMLSDGQSALDVASTQLSVTANSECCSARPGGTPCLRGRCCFHCR